jgi:hypothetical protein
MLFYRPQQIDFSSYPGCKSIPKDKTQGELQKGISQAADYSLRNTTFEYLNLYSNTECSLSTRLRLP